MKKVLAILVVLALVAGFAFAADSDTGKASIKVLTTIGVEAPVFKIATTSGASTASDTTNNNSLSEATMTSTEKAKLTTQGGEATVVFTLSQSVDSRTYSPYTLTVSATDLYLLKTPEGTPEGNAVDRTFEQAQTAATGTQKFVAQAVSHAFTGTDANMADNGSSTSSVKIKYNGQKVAANAVIGTATVKWGANVQAEAGDYQANVTLTVSAL